MKKVILILALVASSTSSADISNDSSARFYMDGNKLHTGLSIKSSNAAFYVMGVIDSFSGSLICPPETNAKPEQAAQIVLNFLDRVPEAWNMPAYGLVLAALKNLWPCAENKNN